MAGRRRAAAGKRWSAVATVTFYDAARDELPESSCEEPRSALVRWRLDGKGRKRTFPSDELTLVPGFMRDLLNAYEQDWDADDEFRPVRPTRLPGAPADEVDSLDPIAVAECPSGLVPTPAPVTLLLPGIGDRPQKAMDVPRLIRWYQDDCSTRHSRKTGRKLASNTIEGYRYELQFFEEFMRYLPGDPRLPLVGRDAHAPMLITTPEMGISERDLLDFFTHRQRTNLATRSRNEQAMARWVKEVNKEERLAAKAGRDPVLPPAPQMLAEEASPRTVASSAKLIKAMLERAHLLNTITYQPWTPRIEDLLVPVTRQSYSRKTVPSRAQIDRIVAAMRTHLRDAVIDGVWAQIDGDRYAAMIMLAGYEALRPEESVALRRSWLELDHSSPRIVLYNAEVDGKKVPLKHRGEDEERYIYLDGEPELVEELRRHLERYVPEADPTADPDSPAYDPYVFTTFAGSRIDLGKFSSRWYRPVVLATLTQPGEQALAKTTFRLLRASAITHWLSVRRWSRHECALAAGNSADVIEKHYAGVIAELRKSQPHTAAAGLDTNDQGQPNVSTLMEALASMDLGELGAIAEQVKRLITDQAAQM